MRKKDDYIGKSDGKITQAEIDNHKRTAKSGQHSYRQVDETQHQLKKLVQNFAQFGELYRAAMAIGMNPQVARGHLARLGVYTIEDARNMINNGVLSEVARDNLEAMQEAKLASDALREEQEARLQEHEEKISSLKDDTKKISREDADRRNLSDKIRNEIHSDNARSSFRVPDGQEQHFKTLVMTSASKAQKTLGCTRDELISEVKRLLPSIDVDMLRW